MDICTLELPLARAMGLNEQLKAKREDYFVRIKGPNGSWDPSWSTKDLIFRHNHDSDFRLCYYKFVILSSLLIACEKNAAQIKRMEPVIADSINTKCIAIDLASTLATRIDTEEFNAACEVIQDYLTGSRPLGETQSIS